MHSVKIDGILLNCVESRIVLILVVKKNKANQCKYKYKVMVLTSIILIHYISGLVYALSETLV